ncbi:MULTISPECIES: AraC family transcriptional regulator [Cohnella]|uniref:AraC family transcriptional regulator n=1 Tax=Cohnella TaxID=329857 RepID=UPI000E38E954|nr:AraC family transcriptional regulator [Cohnella sp.]REK66228.1 MAG: AraC family transcriptional regulator [Cohnella sp.]
MARPAALLEPMDMPDPRFPVKVHYCTSASSGHLLFPNHWHKHLEILHCLSGKALIECNSSPMTMEAGETVIVNSNDLHAGTCLSNDLAYYALIVDPSLLQSPSPDAAETKYIESVADNRLLFRHKSASSREIGSLIQAIVEELRTRETGFELSVKSYLYRILTLLIRRDVAQVLTATEDKLRTKNLERLTPVLQFMETNYAEPLHVDRLAGLAGLSRYHFGRLFKQVTGRTVTEYATWIRVGNAEQLLRNTTHTISEIAEMTGFRDIYYFSRMFKKWNGISPSEWRKRAEHALPGYSSTATALTGEPSPPSIGSGKP